MHLSKRIIECSVVLLAALTLLVSGLTPTNAQAPVNKGGEATPPPKTPQKRSFLISRDVPDPAAVDRGKGLFVASCGFCHGANARGGESGPDLVRSVLALRDEGGDQIGPVIRQGVPAKGMPGFPSMTDEQIADMAAFLRAQQQAAINRGNYEIHDVVTGDAKKGEAYFNGAGGCKGCHSPGGDLKGIAGRFEPVNLQTHFLFPGPRRSAAASTKARSTVTVTPASGPAVSGVLSYIDDFNVALRDDSGTYHSFTRKKGLKVEVRDPLQAHVDLLKKYTDDDIHNLLAYLVTLK